MNFETARTSALALVALVALTLGANAANWTVVPTESRIGFSGEHAGAKFKGVFDKWDAAITFDPANLAAAKATVTVQLASAKTGDPTYDKTLPTADWFDVAKSPTGVFETVAFRATNAGAYEADATLTIRGFKVPMVFAFTWTPSGDTAKLVGKAQVKRTAFGIGKGSDEPGAWVSLDIPIDVTASLKKAP